MNVADWLRTLGLEQYEAAFRENDVSAVVLPSLTAEDLKDLGVTSVGHRRQILEAIAALHTDALALADPIQASRSLAGSPAIGDRSVGSTPERRQLTVMFCDLVSSTALSEKHDPEDLSEILRVYQARVQETIARFGGFIARYVGDGVLVYFGWPAAQETDAERAVRAALAVASTSDCRFTDVRGPPLTNRCGNPPEESPAAPPPGFEPGPSEPKSEVLPLHHGGLASHGPMCVGLALLRHGPLVCPVTTSDENDGDFARRA